MYIVFRKIFVIRNSCCFLHLNENNYEIEFIPARTKNVIVLETMQLILQIFVHKTQF